MQELNGRFVGGHEFFLRLADEIFTSSFDYFGTGPNEESMEQAL